MAGYPIESLKKAEEITGLDVIPLQQNGITKQLERSIMDQAVLIKESGAQSSGVIRKEGIFVLKNETKINFTLESAAGRIVENNEYKDSVEAASGWKIYVVNISGIEHTVIHGANSWPVPAGEILCFYWTGSRFTLHNIVINNLTVRGDTKLLNVSAIQALAVSNKIPVIGTDGKLASTTAQSIVDLANVDSKISSALTEYNNGIVMEDLDLNNYKTAGKYLSKINTSYTNSPVQNFALEVVKTLNGGNYCNQFITTYNGVKIYVRSLEYKNNEAVWSSWETLATESALANYQSKNYITSLTDANQATSNGITNSFRVGQSCLNIPINRIGILTSYGYVSGQYHRTTQEFMTNDDNVNSGVKYIRYGMSNNNGTSWTWSDWQKIISDKLEVGTVSAGEVGTIGTVNNHLIKTGRICELSLTVDSVTTSNTGWLTIGVLPEGFRPNKTIWGFFYDNVNNRFFRGDINPNGIIEIRVTVGTTLNNVVLNHSSTFIV